MPDDSQKSRNRSFSNPVGRSSYARYAIGVSAVLIAWAGRYALMPLWGSNELPFIFFYPAIVFAAWFGRRGPGVLALGLSALVADWFFISPVHSFTISTFRDVAALGAFIVSCLFIIVAIEAMHRAKARALAELTERERVEAELVHVREMFATTIGRMANLPGPTDVSRASFVKSSARIANHGARVIGPIFLAAAILLVASTVFVYQVGLMRIHAQERMSSELLVLQQLDDFLSSVKDAETGQRGYLLTGDARYLQPYNEAITQVRMQVQRLQQLALSGDLQEEDVQRVSALTDQKLSELQRTISLRRDKGLDAALSIVRDNQGKQVMDQLRTETGKMRAAEEQAFAAFGRRAGWAASLRTMTFIGACLLNLVFLGWAYRKISAEAHHRETARRETAQQKELLATTVGSIGDAVIVADEKGNVISLNPEAERLTGWSSSQASGRPLSEVFVIINATTRQPAENPVDKVLRLGGVVGFPNHTVLIARDGREIPIDDSAAPIRQEGGPLFGIVLVFRDFTERKRAEEEREELLTREHEQRQIAEEANRLKDEFLAIMSHELRNPLNVILGYSELLVRNDDINQLPQVHCMAEAIRRNAKAQSKLICDLLDLSRLRSGKLELNRETVAMTVSVNNAIDTVRSDAEAKHITIEFEQPDESLFIEGDPVRMEQIVWNLLNNSVKFSSTGSRIEVRLGKDGEQVILAVDDSGQGIDPSFLPHVFELFRQADASTKRSQSGMGIGLAVVQQLVDLHGGSISAHSAGLGKGATFTVKLPLSLEIKTELAPVVGLTKTLHEFSVMVVDDSEDTAEMLAAVLKTSGANVTSATSGDEALLILAEKEFDIVLSDISMPGMDGFEFLRQLRQLPGRSDVPVLALTGFGRPEDIERAKNEGFFSHVTKPFDLDALMALLKKIPRKKDQPDRT